MCGGRTGAAAVPAPAAKLPEAPTTPVQTTGDGQGTKDRRRRAGGGGNTGTILTASSGVQNQAAIQQKTLLGA